METEEKYYTPAGPKVEPLAVPKAEISSELAGLADSEGLIKVQLDQEAVLPRIANGIYANFESGFRETFANSITACLNAKDQFGANPKIEISFNPDTRYLEIREVDSTGISFGTFKDIYVIVGRSGNFDGTRPGQFGFGRLAWTTLSDRMVLQTRYRTVDGKTGQFSVEGKNGLAFAILPEPSLEHFGTTVSMVIYDKIDQVRLVKYIGEVSELSPVDTFLTVTGNAEYNHKKLNRSVEDVMTDLSRFFDDYNSRHTTDTYTYGISDVYVFKEPDFEVYAVNITEKQTNMADIPRVDVDSTHAVLLNLPIMTNIRLPFTRALIRILDERALPPSADRERLKEETEEKILAKLQPHLAKHFSRYIVRTIDEFKKLSLTDKAILYAVVGTGGIGWRNNQQTSFFLDGQTRDFIQSLQRSRVNVRGIYENKRKHLMDLGTLMTFFATDEMFIEDVTYQSRRLKTLRTAIPRAIILMKDSYLGRETEPLLDQLGLKTAKAYIEANGLKLPPQPRKPRGYTIHMSKISGGGLGKDETLTYSTADEVPDTNLIRIPRKETVTKYSALLDRVHTKYKLILSDDLTKGTSLDSFVATIGASTQVTSKGEMPVSDILSHDDFFIALDNDPNVAKEIYGEDSRLAIFVPDTDRMFELALYLTKNAKTYTIAIDASEEFHRLTGKSAYDFYKRYSYNGVDKSTLIWSMLRVWLVCADKDVATLMMHGLSNVKDEDMAKYTEKALAIARQISAPI